MLKVLIHLNDNSNFSRIFQIASVSFTKDDIEIFKRTVLDRIGSSLKLFVMVDIFPFTNCKIVMSWTSASKPLKETMQFVVHRFDCLRLVI